MGCDIHLYTEYKRPGATRWISFGKRLNPGRIYGLFAALGDVRNDYGYTPIAAERGLPEGVGSEARSDNMYWITDGEAGEDEVTREKANYWVENGYSEIVEEKWVTNPDWHSHSWATVDEFEQAINEVFLKDGSWRGDYIEYLAVLASMKEFIKHGCECRVVFWFDN
jgi:hypothetical protein